MPSNAFERTDAALPARFRPSAALLRREGPALRRLGALLYQGDPVADAACAAMAELPPGQGFAWLEAGLARGRHAPELARAPAALHALLADVEEPPRSRDRLREARGGRVVLRAGLAGGVVLGMKSLMLGYASPGGNKPLVFSGRLRQQASRRLAETSRFVQAVSQPGGLDRGAPGHAITVKVRVMHAQVRRLITGSGRWRSELWGVPINQHDMLATVLLFSVAMVDGLRALGYHVGAAEADDLVHLWRHVGRLMGVAPELLPADFASGLALAELIRDSQGPPDDDARALARALFDARQALSTDAGAAPAAVAQERAAMHAVCRLLIGDTLADQLGLPRSPVDHLARVVRPVAALASRVARLPHLEARAVAAGNRYWDAAVAEGLGGATARYAPPDRLSSATG